MKDLKHLIWFEDLLQQANNELVQRAAAEGQLALGYNCYYIPEVLLNLPGCFSSRLRAPNSGTAEIASYYMTNRNCPYVRCILERAIEGGFNYLNALFGAEGCAAMERMEEHFTLLKPVKNDRFITTIIDPPMKGDRTSLDYYKAQLKAKVLDALRDSFGVDTSDDAIRAAIEKHNRLCRVITEIGDLRKAENPVITGYEFHVLNLVSFTCPKYLILPYLRETLTELKKRKPDPKPAFRARVAIVGSEIDDPQLTKLIEGCGALVVSDRYCFGSTPGREIIELRDGEEALPQICMHIMQHSECARYIADEKVQQRRETADRLAREYHADGIIYEQMKYCDYWGFERALVSHIMHEEYDWPVLSIDRLYNNGNSGQLRTRVQAFVESLEIKKLHKQNGGAN